MSAPAAWKKPLLLLLLQKAGAAALHVRSSGGSFFSGRERTGTTLDQAGTIVANNANARMSDHAPRGGMSAVAGCVSRKPNSAIAPAAPWLWR